MKEILLEVMCQCDNQPKAVMEKRAIALLEEVGLSKVYMDKYPNMLSGGEAQRSDCPRDKHESPIHIV